jgi:hypothetical protein
MTAARRPVPADAWRLCRMLSDMSGAPLGCGCMARGARPCPSVARLFSKPGGGWLTVEAAAATPAAGREAGNRAARAATPGAPSGVCDRIGSGVGHGDG